MGNQRRLTRWASAHPLTIRSSRDRSAVAGRDGRIPANQINASANKVWRRLMCLPRCRQPARLNRRRPASIPVARCRSARSRRCCRRRLPNTGTVHDTNPENPTADRHQLGERCSCPGSALAQYGAPDGEMADIRRRSRTYALFRIVRHRRLEFRRSGSGLALEKTSISARAPNIASSRRRSWSTAYGRGAADSTGGTRRAVVALDARTGESLWTFSLREGERGEVAPRQLYVRAGLILAGWVRPPGGTGRQGNTGWFM